MRRGEETILGWVAKMLTAAAADHAADLPGRRRQNF